MPESEVFSIPAVVQVMAVVARSTLPPPPSSPLCSLVCRHMPKHFVAGVEAHVQGQTQNVGQMADSPHRAAA